MVNVWKLRTAMLGTLALIIGFSTLLITVLLSITGTFSLTSLLVFVITLNLAQWLVAPYIIEGLYGVKEADPESYRELHAMLESLSSKAGIRKPKLMIAETPVPNAFAYGSPLSGPRVAVTRGLLNNLSNEEIEAVLGHELGHLKHRDVQLMMFASVLPSLFYILSRYFFFAGYEEERRGDVIAISLISLAAYYVLSLFTLYLSRLREYYADFFSVQIAPNPREGSRRLMNALAKIVLSTSKLKTSGMKLGIMGFKELLIADPDSAETEASALSSTYGIDEGVRRLLKRKLTLAERLIELFSTHPNIVKRLKALEELAR